MKVHYINILLFALPLNILLLSSQENIQRNHKSIPEYTETTRLLCECELYTPANYDRDPEMKKVMDNFNKQTQQKFHEYDDRMVEKRKRCKDKWDKNIQKIILKDKLEKQMEEQLTTLETKIDTDDIPTCICEKSIADKVEKKFLLCGGMLSGGIAPSVGLFGAVAIGAWKNAAIIAAKESAEKFGAAQGAIAGVEAGIDVVIEELQTLTIYQVGSKSLGSIICPQNYTNFTMISKIISDRKAQLCSVSTARKANLPMCEQITNKLGTVGNNPLPDSLAIKAKVEGILTEAKTASDSKAAEVAASETAAAIKTKTGAIEAATPPYYTPIIASIIAIEVIVLIMVIIYLILRYRRKKKMKKKLQYIKLLEE
ncbi:rifin [Plasmodium reichenowi]|uniref:Rifin n=1 Tax=Plasmodium reichenowi TaxID=5854 RepID=A0A060RM54_PLARE|nr:rifin [Plasmodium reichenowi]